MGKIIAQHHLLSIIMACFGLMPFNYTAKASVADGVYAYEHGDYETARLEWLPFAEAGNPNALYNLGQLYRMGRGVKIDFLKAEEYYLRAAEVGHIGAQRNLGTLYYFGRLGKKDYEMAHGWLSKAAISGDPRSQLMIGVMNFNGEAVEKNHIKAYAWVHLASKSGLGKAKSTLNKIQNIMTESQIAEAEKLTANLTIKKITPDDLGLMVKQPDPIAKINPKLNPKTKKNAVAQKSFSTAEYAANKTVAPPVEDRYRVQIGAFREERLAEKTFQNLKKRLPESLRNRRKEIELADLGAEKGIFYRLQLGRFDTKATAIKFCTALKSRGQSCYVVKKPRAPRP